MARSLKILPNYDPIFFETSKRDDPDAILEGWSALYHVDRVNLRVSASDVLLGEDGTVTFAPQDVFYDELQISNVAVAFDGDQRQSRCSVGTAISGILSGWAVGLANIGARPVCPDWPKSGSHLGGGYSAGVSWAGERDPSIEDTMMRPMKPQVNFDLISMGQYSKETSHRRHDVDHP